LSDIHFGHGPASHRWDQQLVLSALHEDLLRLEARRIPKPDVIFITGDIAFSGLKSQYDGAARWLEELIAEIKLSTSDVFSVPGNHDVQRDVDGTNRQVSRLIDRLRSGDESLDEALGSQSDKELLEKRLINYLDFTKQFFATPDEFQSTSLFWCRNRTAPPGLVLRIIGLNTAILAADEDDKEKLRVGNEQLAMGLASGFASSGEVTIVLSHHPFNWLADSKNVAAWVQSRGQIHLSGHIHEAESERLRKGGGTDLVSVVAGAVHGDNNSVTGHGYSIGSILAGADSKLRLRIWPRMWSDVNKDFRMSVEQIPEDSAFVDHDLGMMLTHGAMESTGYVPVDVDDEKRITISQNIAQPEAIPIQRPNISEVKIVFPQFHQEHPPLVTAFVGRQHELQLLAETVAVAAVTGIGGQGKSALATSYLKSSLDVGRYEFSDWRDCREEGNQLHAQIVSIIERLTQGNVRGTQLVGADDESLIRYFFGIVGQRRALFVFDNVDQYVDLETGRAIGILNSIIKNALKAGHRAQFLFTCRPDLQYEEDGFQQIRLSGLTMKETETLFELRGVQIANERVRADIKIAHELTQGHALWLNLIATQVARMGATLGALIGDLRRSTASHLPNAMLRSIWRTLTDKQKVVLRCLAETPRAETEERLADYVANVLHWNQYRRAVKTLKTLNLVVIKPVPGGPDTLELHPLIREFIRTEYSPKEREKFIVIACQVFDRIIKIFKPQLSKLPSRGILEHWTLRSELAMNRKSYKEALEFLYDAAMPLVANGYVEDFVRVACRFMSEVDWTEAVIENYQHFDWVVQELAEQLSHLGRYREVDELAQKYEEVIIGKSARFINLCNLRCYSYWVRGEFDKAIDWGTKGVNLKRTAHVDTHFDCDHNLALSQRDAGEVAQALKYFLQDQTVNELLDRSQKGESRASHVFGNVGRCLSLLGETQKALKCVRRSAIMLETETDSNSLINQGWAAFWLGEILENSGRPELAYAFLKRAEEVEYLFPYQG
jgi:tetratricopeptide (TPR) repeat protein